MTDDKKARKEEIENHAEMLEAVIEQQKEYSLLMALDLTSSGLLAWIAYFNFSTFVANVLIGIAVYLLFGSFKRFVYLRAVKVIREEQFNHLSVLLAAWKKDYE